MATRGQEIGVGVLVSGALALFTWMALSVGALSDGGERVRVSATLTDAAGLDAGASVRIAGVEVGRVQSLSVEFNRARLWMLVDTAAGVRSDVTVLVRARSLLGEKYVELVPHSPDAPPLQEGDELAAPTGQIEMDEMVARVTPLLEAVDPEALARVLRALDLAIADDPDRPRRILVEVERAAQGAAVAAEAAPALVADARSTLSSVRRVSDAALPAVRHADATLLAAQERIDAIPPEQLRMMMSEVEAAVKDGRLVVERLEGGGDRIDRVLTNLEGIDKWELRRLLREEGIVIRLRPQKVVPDESAP